jgi:hypothetical protein
MIALDYNGANCDGIRDAGLRMRDAGYGIRDTGCGILDNL